MVPSFETIQKFGLNQKTRYMGNVELENLIMDNRSKYGILATKDKAVAENPALLREAMRPSLVTQHINH